MKPILFNSEMVLALLSGQKTQTRRKYKGLRSRFDFVYDDTISPYGKIGDHLWVRETLLIKDDSSVCYAVDNIPVTCKESIFYRRPGYSGQLPSIFMKKKFSRITLEITNLKVERLLDISEGDVYKEGVSRECSNSRTEYKLLWNTINGKKYPWDSNPFVWVIEFDVIIDHVSKIIR